MTIHDRVDALATVQQSRQLGDWTYGVAGQGPAVLLLTGGAGIGWLDLVLALHTGYRTIAVDYPPGISTIDDLTRGVLDVLDAQAHGFAPRRRDPGLFRRRAFTAGEQAR